ncbi:MAG: SUMF1/EgtB/PvdO family nonheme iron enzyme [Saprospiraceae bacterium]
MLAPVKIFIIYAHEDAEYKDKLITAFALLKKNGLVETWHDGIIKPGAIWEKEIGDNLNIAQIILPLISFNFFNSDYIQNIEIEKAFEREKTGEAKILPIIVDDCNWQDHNRLVQFQVLPKNGKPIVLWDNMASAFTSIIEGLKLVITDFQAKELHFFDNDLNEKVNPDFPPKPLELPEDNFIPSLWKNFHFLSFSIIGILIFLIAYVKFTYKAPTEQIRFQEEMVLVKGGSFNIGDGFGEGESNEYPIFKVTISDFYISKYEVTFSEFDRFADSMNRIRPRDNKGWGRGKRPVINVSWYDAIEYCNWLSEERGRTPYYNISKEFRDKNNLQISDIKHWLVTTNSNSNGFRLPTEAEWEYAARQLGEKVRFGNGRDIAKPREINFNADSTWQNMYYIYSEKYSELDTPIRKTCPVDTLSFPPNKVKLMHMSGNVMEWCWDWYNDSTYYHIRRTIDPKGDNYGLFRVVRGGGWGSDAFRCRASCRSNSCFLADRGYSQLGFRIACNK